MPVIEMRVKRGWQSLGWGERSPTLEESAKLVLRGFAANEVVWLGPLEVRADQGGCLSISLNNNQKLAGHLGFIEVARESGYVVGELLILPDKISERNYQDLRADLEKVWVGLLFDPRSASALSARLPSPRTMWNSIASSLQDIIAEPTAVIASGSGVKRLDSVRKPSELTASVLRRSAYLVANARDNLPAETSSQTFTRTADMQRPGRSVVLKRDVNVPENALVAETLYRLAVYARRSTDGLEVSTRAQRMLRSYPFADCRWQRRDISAALTRVRYDPRYQQIAQVHKILEGPEAYATEGPGDVRFGVKGISRLYEYWVYLQVLLACQKKYGEPLEPGFDVLGYRTHAGTTRLELPEGTTVRFKPDILVAFEPSITADGKGWQKLENVPNPQPKIAKNTIKPDVVVLKLGKEPQAVVFDAKYINRHWVETAALKVHAHYSRIRLAGKPIVSQVIVAHPHEGIDYLWAGYGSTPMSPGHESDIGLLLP